MGRLRSRKFLIIPTRQYFYKDTKNLVCDEKTFRADLTFRHGLQKKVRSGTMKTV